MNCTEFEIEWASLEDSSRLPAGMEDHRRVCRHCSELAEELTSILDRARELRLDEEPPQRVWIAVQNQLEREELIREPVASNLTRRWKAAPAPGWLFRLPMGLAYAAVFFVGVGVMYLNSLLSSPAAPPILVVTAPVPEMALARAGTAGQDKDVEALIAKVPEEHRATFFSNWNQVNSSIQNLQTFIETHPDDPFATPQLRNAFQQREYLRQSLVGREELQ